MNPMIQVIVAGGAKLYREAIAAALRSNADFTVSTAASPGKIVLPLPADTVVVQLCSPGADGMDPREQKCIPVGGSRCLLISCTLPRHEALHLLRQEIGGIFWLENSLSDLSKAIHVIASGGKWLDGEYIQILVAALNGADKGSGFSARERDVLGFVADGMTNKEIATRLGISESAVKATLQRLFQKAGVRTRSQLVRTVLEWRLGSP